MHPWRLGDARRASGHAALNSVACGLPASGYVTAACDGAQRGQRGGGAGLASHAAILSLGLRLSRQPGPGVILILADGRAQRLDRLEALFVAQLVQQLDRDHPAVA